MQRFSLPRNDCYFQEVFAFEKPFLLLTTVLVWKKEKSEILEATLTGRSPLPGASIFHTDPLSQPRIFLFLESSPTEAFAGFF